MHSDAEETIMGPKGHPGGQGVFFATLFGKGTFLIHLRVWMTCAIVTFKVPTTCT